MDQRTKQLLIAGGVALVGGWATYKLLYAYNPEETFEIVEEPDIPSDTPSVSVVSQTSDTPTGLQLLRAAERYAGVPYVFGKASPEDGFDCSSLIQRAAADLGVQIPRLASNQYLACRNAGLEIAEEQARVTAGALIFFYDKDAPAGSKRSNAFHVAMSVVGNGTQDFEAMGSGTKVGYYKWGWWHNWFAKKKEKGEGDFGARYALLPGFNYN